MAKKTTTTAKKAPTKAATTSTPVRNTPIPKVSALSVATAPAVAAPKVISHADIALRAHEIAMSGRGGDETHNWLTAERELRGV